MRVVTWGKMSRRRIILLSAAILLPVLWMALASFVWARGTQTPYSPLAWYNATQWWQANWWCKLWLVLGGALPTILAAVTIRFGVRWWWYGPVPRMNSSVPRSASHLHGDSNWTSMDDATRLWKDHDPRYGALVIGEAYDPRRDKGFFHPRHRSTWGHGGTAPLLVDPCTDGPTHAVMIGGSGAGKTAAAVTRACHWWGPLIAIDPKHELAPMLNRDRRRMGRRPMVLSVDNAPNINFNVLDWIDITKVRAETQIYTTVDWICGYTPKAESTHRFFKQQGKDLVTTMLAAMLWDPTIDPDLKTLAMLRRLLAVPVDDIRQDLQRIYETSPSRLARDWAGSLIGLPEETFGGIYSDANLDTRWLSFERYAQLVSGNAFKTADLIDGGVDVFLALNISELMATPAIARCIVGALLNSIYLRDGNFDTRVLGILDEAVRLDRMQELEVAIETGRAYGLTLLFLYQDASQIKRQFGQDGEQLLNSTTSWRSYSSVNDIKLATEIEKSLGTYSAVASSTSSNRSGQVVGRRNWGRGANSYLVQVPLMRAADIMKLRRDAQIVIANNTARLLCGIPLCFRRDEIMRRIGLNRFVRRRMTWPNRVTGTNTMRGWISGWKTATRQRGRMRLPESLPGTAQQSTATESSNLSGR